MGTLTNVQFARCSVDGKDRRNEATWPSTPGMAKNSAEPLKSAGGNCVQRRTIQRVERTPEQVAKWPFFSLLILPQRLVPAMIAANPHYRCATAGQPGCHSVGSFWVCSSPYSGLSECSRPAETICILERRLPPFPRPRIWLKCPLENTATANFHAQDQSAVQSRDLRRFLLSCLAALCELLSWRWSTLES
jgi:hypothetical protein